MRQLLITTTLFALAAHSAWAGPHFDGSYKGDGALGPMTLVLHETTAGAVSGTMSNEEGTYQVAGSTTGAGIHATFTGPEADDTFEGDLTLSGGRVSMDLTSTTDASIKVHLDFDRTGGAPSTKPEKPSTKHKPAVVSPPAPTHATQSYSGWKTYRNATGISIKYPSTWSANENGGVLKFVPPDAASGANGATEAYLVIAASSEGITDVNDPRVAQTAQATMAQIMPFLQVDGEPQPVSAGTGHGISMTWQGDNPQGMHVLAKCFTTIVEGYGISVIGLGDRTQVTKRLPIVQKIFASLYAGAGDIDQQLVGRWHYWSYHGSPSGSHSEEVDIHVALMADGTCTMSRKSENAYTFTEATGENSGGGVADNSGADHGSWNASHGKLFVRWNGAGAAAYEYALTANGLNVRAMGSTDKPAEWTRE